MKFEIVCNLKVCSLGSALDRQKCQQWIATTDGQCPRSNDDAAFAYKALTYSTWFSMFLQKKILIET